MAARARDPLACDVCLDRAHPGGTMLLETSHDLGMPLVERVHLVCARGCTHPALGRRTEDGLRSVHAVPLAQIADADPFDHVEQIVPRFDWKRGTVERYVEVLCHVRRGDLD